VEEFIERPKKSLAEEFFRKENYFWNSGMFLFPLGIMIEEFKEKAPKIFENINNFEKIESFPIDKAIIEKSNKVVVMPIDFQWSDIGSWMLFIRFKKR